MSDDFTMVGGIPTYKPKSAEEILRAELRLMEADRNMWREQSNANFVAVRRAESRVKELEAELKVTRTRLRTTESARDELRAATEPGERADG